MEPLEQFLGQFGAERPQGVTAALRALARRRAWDWVLEAELCWEVHNRAHWQRAEDAAGRVYPSEEAYWEDVLDLHSWRAVGKRLAIGCALERVPGEERTELRQNLAGVGLAKTAILVPLFRAWTDEGQPWDAARWRVWLRHAQAARPEELQRRVSDALGAKPRGLGEPGARFRAYVTAAMPDLDTRQLAEEFFRAGARIVDSKNPVAVQIAAMQECLLEWHGRRAVTS